MAQFEDELLALLPRVRRFARALVRDRSEADDLVQTALEKALRARSSWDASQRMDGWMLRITRNAWIDMGRARTRAAETFAPENAGFAVGDPGHIRVEAAVEAARVTAAMHRLPNDQREALALVIVDGLAYKEAAAVLDVPIGTLTSRLVRGRQALMAQLGAAA